MRDYTSKEDEDFFGAIGRLTISWAHIEAGVDFAVLAVYHGLNGAKIEPDLPRSLSRKLTFLEKAMRLRPELAEYKSRFSDLTKQIQATSESRHDVIHGFAIDNIAVPDIYQIAIRFVREKNSWSAKSIVLDTVTVLKLAVAANKLATQSLGFGMELIGKFLRT